MLDLYERKARLTPGLLAVAPIPIAIATLGLKQLPAVAITGSILVAAGGTYLLAVLVGRFGRRAQSDMERNWGGLPTTKLLRMRSTAPNPTQRDLWRAAIIRVTGVTLLMPEEERVDPRRADDTIIAAVGSVLRLGHGGAGHPLAAAENAQFGLERNLFGFRWVARVIAAICLLSLVAALLFAHGPSMAAVGAGLVIDALILLGWVVVPSEARAHEAGIRYATQLFHAVTNEANANVNRAAGPAGASS